MDSTDVKIINALRENSRQSIQKIAKKTAIPLTTVHYRLRNMMNENALRFTVKPDRKFTGRELVAFILIKAMPGVQHEKLMKQILMRDEVEEGAIVTGDFDMVVLASVKNMEKLNDFVLKFLRTSRDVAETHTMICYSIEEK